MKIQDAPPFPASSYFLPPLKPLTTLPPNYRRDVPLPFTKEELETDLDAEMATRKHGAGKNARTGRRARRRAWRAKLTTIRLYGVLGRKYGRKWKLDVANVREAIAAIDALRPGFRAAILRLDQGFDFIVQYGDRGQKSVSERELDLYNHGKTICITPVAHGSGGKGVGIGEAILGVVEIIVGVVLIATGYGAAVGVPVILGGIGFLAGGVAALIASTPQTTQGNGTRTSYQFSGAENIAAQGAPCALAYGAPFCGSIVGSSSISSADYRTGTVKNPNKTINSNTIGGLFSEVLGDGTIINVDGPGAGAGGSLQVPTGGGGGGGGGPTGPVLAEYFPQRSQQEIREAMGSGGGGSSTGATEADDTLQSRQYAAIQDIICEGPIKGLYAAEQSVILDDTVVQNSDNTYNFEDYEIHFVSGRQDQDFIPGFDSQEATEEENIQLRQDTPFVREIENPNLDAVRVTMQLPRLSRTDSHNGNVSGASVQITIELNIGGQGWIQKINDNIVGKASNAYSRDYRIDIPADNRPGTYQIRVTRITDDSTSQLLSNDTYVLATTQIVYVKLKHPNTVVCALKFNAQQFSNIPKRTYRLYGMLIKVPSNYDPDAHTYTGDWDGTFKTAWTCNPAWILWDILIAKRYGIGNYLKRKNLDKWAFYRAGQYCDQLVPDGFGGQERRYECHAYIAGREDALQVVSDIAGIFRAASAYMAGQVTPVLDRFVDPSEYAMQFFPGNVIDGDFKFSNTSRKARHTVALVTWYDPTQNGAPQVEYVEDTPGVNRYGVRELNITAMGCYSRGQAHRMGQWALITEATRTTMVTFSALLEGTALRPGDIIPLQVPFRAGRSMSGRIGDGCTNTQIVLDRPVEIDAGNVYQLSLADAVTGALIEVNVANGPGTYTTLNLTAAMANVPAPESAWILISSNLVPELFRVQGMTMTSAAACEVTAINYNPSLYDAVDQGTNLETYPTSVTPSPVNCQPPTDLIVTERAVVQATGVQRVLEATWTGSPDAFLRDYGISYRIEKGNWVILPDSITTTVDIPIQVTGDYEFSVKAYNSLGAPSSTIDTSYTVTDVNPIPLFTVTGVELTAQGNNFVFQTRDPKFDWRLNSPALAQDIGDESNGVQEGSYDPFFKDFQVQILDAITGAVVWTEYVADPSYTFTEDKNAQAFGTPRAQFTIAVSARDTYNNVSAADTITVNNPPPAPPSALTQRSAFKSFFANWINATDIDLAGTELLISSTGDVSDAVVFDAGLADSFVQAGLVSGQTYTIWVRSYDTFGSRSNVFPTNGVAVQPGTIEATDLAQFATLLTGDFGNIVVLQGDEWTDHSPTPTAIAWNAHEIFYKGEATEIAAGSTTDAWVYWIAGETSYRTSQTNPSTATTDATDHTAWSNNDHFQIARNLAGVHEMAWYGFANAVIGSAYIADAAITTAKIQDLAVDDAKIANVTAGKITSGEVDSALIVLTYDATITPAHPVATAGVIMSSNYQSGVAGMFINGQGLSEFNDTTVRGALKASTIDTDCNLQNSAYAGNFFPSTASAQVKIPNTTFGNVQSNSFVLSNGNTITVNTDVYVVDGCRLYGVGTNPATIPSPNRRLGRLQGNPITVAFDGKLTLATAWYRIGSPSDPWKLIRKYRDSGGLATIFVDVPANSYIEFAVSSCKANGTIPDSSTSINAGFMNVIAYNF